MTKQELKNLIKETINEFDAGAHNDDISHEQPVDQYTVNRGEKSQTPASSKVCRNLDNQRINISNATNEDITVTISKIHVNGTELINIAVRKGGTQHAV